MKNNKQLIKQIENKTLLIWKMAIASALSWEIAKLAGSDHPYLAPISVILCVQTTINRSIRFSYHRMVGTVIGITVVVLVEPYLKVNGWILGLLILVGCFIAKWLKRDESAIHQVALTVLLVFVMEHKSGDYPTDRFRDTLIGALVAVILHMLFFPPNYTKQVLNSVNDFSKHLAHSLNRTASWVKKGAHETEGNHLQLTTKHLLQELHQIQNLFTDASDSLKFNFFASKSKKSLQQHQQRIQHLTLGYNYLAASIEILCAWGAAGPIPKHYQMAWSEQIQSIASILQIKNHPADAAPQGESLLKISLPQELVEQQYHVSLYRATTDLLNNIQRSQD
jgi:uncharacterized membrane protein YgaE (UPF0421/DUF939 family)